MRVSPPSATAIAVSLQVSAEILRASRNTQNDNSRHPHALTTQQHAISSHPKWWLQVDLVPNS
jgi:hypothetical protein